MTRCRSQLSPLMDANLIQLEGEVSTVSKARFKMPMDLCAPALCKHSRSYAACLQNDATLLASATRLSSPCRLQFPVYTELLSSSFWLQPLARTVVQYTHFLYMQASAAQS